MDNIKQRKIRLFIDADDTILESPKALIDIVNRQDNINPPKIYE